MTVVERAGGPGRRARRRPPGRRRGVRGRHAAARAAGQDARGTSRCSCWPTASSTSSTSASGSARCSVGTRRSSRRRRRRCSTRSTRQRIGEAACDVARSVGYVGAGTVEFLVSDEAPTEFFFMEMNTRLQVEHPVTELVTGLDLVEWQLRVAAGEPLTVRQDDVGPDRSRVEARVYAEDPRRDFLPSAGTVHVLDEPTGDGIRVDSALRRGPGDRVGLRPDARQGHRVGARPGRRRSRGWTPPCRGRRSSASAPTSSSCGRCWPTPTCAPAGSTPACSRG